LGEYAQYLETNEDLNKRYLGNALDEQSAGFTIGKQTRTFMRDDAIAILQSDGFVRWMAVYFSTPRHEDLHEDLEGDDENEMSHDELLDSLKKGEILYRAQQVKLVIVPIDKNQITLAVDGEQINVSAEQKKLIEALNKENKITFSDIENCDDKDEAIRLLIFLYRYKALIL